MTSTVVGSGAAARIPKQPTRNLDDLLLELAKTAQSWRRTILDAHSALADPAATPLTRPFDVAVGAEAIERILLDLLRPARRASVWLQQRDNAGAETTIDLLDLAAAQPRLRVRALVGSADSATLPARAGRPSANPLDVRVSTARQPDGGKPHDTLVVDGTTLAVLTRDNGLPATMVIAQPTLANVVQGFFDSLWSNAVPVRYVLHMRNVFGGKMKQDILRRLSEGDKDEAIARSLGISLRTCRRYIAEIIAATGAVSRFQAGYLLAYDGLACLGDRRSS